MNPSRLRALLTTLRIANMPSVICNVWLGIVLAMLFVPDYRNFQLHAPKVFAIACAGLLLYAAGNLLNDWKDRAWDQTCRPERALPRGLYQPSTYLAAAVVCLLIAIGLAYSNSTASAITAAIIAINIITYTHWHKGHAWTVIPMGLCRALLPVMGFLAFDASLLFLPMYFDWMDFLIDSMPIEVHDTLWKVVPIIVWILPHSLALLFYIIGLSLSARSESRPTTSSGETWIARSLLVCALLSMSINWMQFEPTAVVALIALIPCAIWLTLCLTRFRKPIPAHVSALLAGIPLLDWVALLAFATYSVYHDHDMHWIIVTCFLLPPTAFLTGRLLQRVAPAT
jgi:heme O synthase-like polyprenyltransferase